MQILNGTRLGALLQSFLYLTTAPLFSERFEFEIPPTSIKSFSYSPEGRRKSLLSQEELSISSESEEGNKTIRNIIPTSTEGIIAYTNLKLFDINDCKSLDLIYKMIEGESGGKVRCYGVLGCIEQKYIEQRGFDLWPEPLETIKPFICLHLHWNRTCREVSPESYNLGVPGTRSYWLTHGYIESGNRPWIQEMVNELLDAKKDVKVFVIDWSRGAEPPYAQATVNIELLAAYVAHFLMLLDEAGEIRVSESHFIGHSLGAHFGGFVGAWLIRKGYLLSRITGLDPAQPYFQNFPIDARLDPSDAHFVDVIHTDAKPLLHGGSITGLGTQEPSGHIDFYPNSGKDQPGCKDGVYQAILQEDGSLIYGLRRMIACDHIRSYEYFTESIRSPCSFMAFSCPSWDSFISSACPISCRGFAPENCNRMGFHAKKPSAFGDNWGFQHVRNDSEVDDTRIIEGSILYYSITGTRVPYCLSHYRIAIFLGVLPIVRITSDLNLVLVGMNGQHVKINLGKRDLRGSLTYEWTVGGSEVGWIVEAILEPSAASPFWWLVNRMVRNPTLSIVAMTVTQLEKAESVRLCPHGNGIISLAASDAKLILRKNACSIFKPPEIPQIHLTGNYLN